MKFIKVSKKDSKDFTVVPDIQKAFYEANGFIVEEPTKDEIEIFHPGKPKESKSAGKTVNKSELDALTTELMTVTAENANLELALEAEKAKVAELEAEIVKLTEVKQ